MQFDIVRAWKDENYRQSLSEEQLNTLPTSPVGELELSDTDLETIYGGWGSGNHNYGSSNGGSQRVGSIALICEINIYTINLSLLPILSSVVQTCNTRA
ncbi:MAG: mersacidin/lichenicidin family type 2 lantibiotic [Ktedonobacteraceae bacterium]